MLNLRVKFFEFITAKLLQRANVYYQKHQYKKAIPLYQKIIKLNPDHYAAYANLAVSYFENSDYQTALKYFLELVKKEKNNPWWHTYLSQTYQKLNQCNKALKSSWQAVISSFGATEQQINFAYALYEISLVKGSDYVRNWAQKFYDKYPVSGIAKQCYQTYVSEKKTDSCDLEYVEKMFDIFAEEFDDVLSSLQYDSPKLIAQELSYLKDNFKCDSTILDLGCGTGLCAQNIKKFLPKISIFGVDISSQMLHFADSKRVYSHLYKQDIIYFLQSSLLQFDAIVASDVLTYMGGLEKVFELVFFNLKKGGNFVFTISQNIYNKKGYFLSPSSRFVHSLAYVKKCLKQSGFYIDKVIEKNIRFENKKPVYGWIILCSKS